MLCRRFSVRLALGTIALAALFAVTAGVSSAAVSKIAICSTQATSYDLDVQAKLVATGLYSTVDLLDCGSGTPSLVTFQGYGAVLAYGDASFADNFALAVNLKAYVDGGGHLVVAVFGFQDSGGLGFGGTVLDTGGYLPFVTAGQTQGDGPLVLVADDPASPLLSGVTSFSGGTSSYRDLVSLASGATLVAHWSGGSTPLVGYKGNVVGLNFYPPSTGARGDFWDATTDGVRLMTNALGSGFVKNTVLQRGGYCSVAGNTYEFSGAAIPPGTFLDLARGQANSPSYKGAVPANYLQGIGITCDVLTGYVKTGETVGNFGSGDPGMYIYYKKA